MHFDPFRVSPARVLRAFAAASLALPCIGLAAPASGAGTPSRDFAAMAQAHAQVQASIVASRSAASSTAAASGAAPNDLVENPYAAYPPSCLGDGLPLGQFDAVRGGQASVLLFGDPAQCLQGGNANECNYSETVTVRTWRVPCSNGTSATLLEFDRPANASTTLYPVLPGVYVIQGNNSLFVRFANDPNTTFTTTYANQPLVFNDIFVLENFYGGATQFDYNQAFTLYVDNFTGNTASNPRGFSFPVYNPANYPDAALALPISGYMSTNWYDPAHNGEGILVQVYDNGDGQTRTFTAAWYTFDDLGIPYWLFAQGAFAIGARSTGDVDTYYGSNGGFAGNFGATATFTKWGTINASFPDCNHMNFSYSGTTGDANGPSGTGTKTGWVRLANINSLACQ